MRIVQSWLKDYTDVRLSPDDIAERLTMIGLEFESVTFPGERYRGFVVGHVLDVQRHPRADRLTVCRVGIGAEELQIVCGAANVAAGQKVPVGLVGATVPRNQHDPSGKPFVLESVSLRGVQSSGMICSAFELDLGSDAEGILVLDPAAGVGTPLSDYLGLNDVIYDVEITPNRPDWLSHIGFARELTVLTGRPLKIPRVQLKETKEPISRHLSVTVEDPLNCPRFAVRMIRGVRVGPSPRWLQDRLTLAGLRPINTVVDVTNYVMYECGHPMHAFDYALLEGRKLVIRPARSETRFETLDGKERVVPQGAIMVCDGEKAISVAGVMGGANSEIGDSTVDVVLESAYWNPSSIRRTAKALGISTDASQRFERGADPQAVIFALNRAAQMIAELAGGTIVKGSIDVYPKPIRERRVSMRPARVNAVLGTRLRQSQMTRFLRPLGIKPVATTKAGVQYAVPTFRVDIEREIDLIEEVARVYGYNNIEDKTRTSVDFVHPFVRSLPADRVRERLVAGGLQELVTNPMQDEARAALGGGKPVRILNPQNQDMQMLRTSLVPGMLDVAARNIRVGSTDMRLFEIGHVFSEDGTADPSFAGAGRYVEGFREQESAAMLLTGMGVPDHWSAPGRRLDFFDLKGGVEALLRSLALDKWRLISYSTDKGLTEQALAIEIHGSYAGYLGSVRGEVLKFFGIEQSVYVAEFALALLTDGRARAFEPIPRYPVVRRDVAFEVPLELPAGQVEDVIRSSAGELLRRVEVFDLYQGAGIAAGTKSLAFGLELQSRDRTLTEGEIDAVVRNVIHRVEQDCRATLRGVKA